MYILGKNKNKNEFLIYNDFILLIFKINYWKKKYYENILTNCKIKIIKNELGTKLKEKVQWNSIDFIFLNNIFNRFINLNNEIKRLKKDEKKSDLIEKFDGNEKYELLFKQLQKVWCIFNERIILYIGLKRDYFIMNYKFLQFWERFWKKG